MRTLCWLMLLLLTAGMVAAYGQGSSSRAEDEAAIKKVVASFIATREDNNPESLRVLLTEDVDQQVTSGSMRSGREAVVKGSLTTTQSTGGDRTIAIEAIRFISADVAIADGPYDIVGRNDGPDRHYRATMVLKKDGGAWKIAAIRNMQPAD